MINDIETVTAFMEFAHKLADRSGEVIRPFFRRSLSVDNKAMHGAFDPVTEADRAAEAAMRELIIANHPDHGIFGEEFENRSAEGPFAWTLDPIDGTRSFMIGLPAWGTLIGLSHDGAPTLGIMDQPHIGERFWGMGTAAHYRHSSGERSAMKTRACPSLCDAILAATAPDMFKEGDKERFAKLSAEVKMTRFGGDCYLYCLLAMGLIDIVAETSLKPFDIAPLVPIIRAAGGIVTTWDGEDPSQGGRIVAVGDPALHETVLKALAG